MPNEYHPQAQNADTVLPGPAAAPQQPQQPAPQQQAPRIGSFEETVSNRANVTGETPEQARRAVLIQESLRNIPGPVSQGGAADIARGTFSAASNIATLFGADDWRNAADSIAARLPREVNDYTDIKDWGDLGTYASERALENTANMLVVLGGTLIGGLPGTVAATTPLAAGETASTLEDEGIEPTVANVAGPTVINTALETFSFLKVFKNSGLAHHFTEAFEESAKVTGFDKQLKEIVTSTGSSFATEASTEALQTFVNQVNVELQQNKSLADAIELLPEEQHELIEAFLSGGFAGGLTTAATQTTVKAADNLEYYKNQKSNAAPKQNGETVDATPAEQDAKEVAVEESVNTPAKEADAKTVRDETTDKDERQVESQAPLSPDPAEQSVQELDKVNQAIANNLESLNVPLETTNPIASFFRATGQSPINQRIARSAYDVREGVVVANEFPTELHVQPASYFDNGRLQSNVTTVGNTQGGTPRTYIAGAGTELFGFKSPRIIQQIADQVEEWRTRYTPNRSIILGSHQEDLFEASKNTAAYQSTLIDSNQAQLAFEQDGTVTAPVSFISVRPDIIRNVTFELAAQNKSELNFTNEDLLALSLSALSHEVGHAIIADNIATTEQAEKNAIYNEYSKFLESISAEGKTVGQVFEELGSPSSLRVKYLPKALQNMDFKSFAENHLSQSDVSYLLSFEEYAAEQIAKNFAGQKVANKPLWDRITQRLRELFKDFSGLFRAKPKFKAWLDNIALKNYRNELLMKVPVSELRVTPKVKDLQEEAGLTENKLRPNYQEDVTSRIAGIAEGDLNDAIIASLKRTERVSTGFNKIWGTILTPTQIAERFKVPQAAEYMENVQRYFITKMRGITQADEISKQWIDLPQAKSDALGRMLFDASELSDQLERRLLPSERQGIAEEHGLGQTELRIYDQIQESFNEVITRLRAAVEIEAVAPYTASPAEMIAELERVGEEGRAQILSEYATGNEEAAYSSLTQAQSQFDALENRDYFPRMRFGQYSVQVRKREVVRGDVRENVEVFEVYETRKEQQEALRFYQAEHGGQKEYDVIAGALSDTARAMYGMPQIVVQSIGDKIRAAEGELTPEQQEALRQAEIDLSPGKAFLRQLRKRKNTKGFSTDALRTYSTYMSSASNHLARIEHSRDMTGSLASLARARSQFAGDVTDLEQLHEYYQDHFKYLFNPENDLAQLRAFGFMWYLGFNVKSAFVNLTQIPLVTLPFLAARYGEVNSVRELSGAYAKVTNHMAQRKALPEEDQRVLDRMTQEGLIDEGMAADLAALSEGSTLQRFISPNRAHKLMADFSYYGSAFFRIAEKYNRRVTALATYNLHKKQGADFEEAYKAARNSVQKSQFEYAKWNRPTFQRGKKSVITLFYNYTQQYLYLITNAERTVEGRRTALYMAAILFAFAGMQGLPGADYLLNSIDFLGTRFKRVFGLNDPRVNIREDIRDIVRETGANPDLLLHGASRYYGTGPLQLANLFGVPVPNVDISGSLSLGQPLPGIRESIQRDPSLGDLILNGLGPVPNVANNVYQMAGNDDPDRWKNFEKVMPVALKNISKATRFAIREKETTRGYAEFIPFDGANPEHWGEIMFQALGFTPTRISEKWDIYGERAAGAAYWTTRRQGIMERYAYAVQSKDKDALIEARKDISHWNKSLTRPELKPYKISNDALRRSLNSKRRAINLRERGLPTTTRDRLYYNSIED